MRDTALSIVVLISDTDQAFTFACPCLNSITTYSFLLGKYLIWMFHSTRHDTSRYQIETPYRESICVYVGSYKKVSRDRGDLFSTRSVEWPRLSRRQIREGQSYSVRGRTCDINVVHRGETLPCEYTYAVGLNSLAQRRQTLPRAWNRRVDLEHRTT